VGGRRVKNARRRSQGSQELQEGEDVGDNPQDVLPAERSTSSSTEVGKVAQGDVMQLMTGQLVAQHIPSVQDLKNNPKAIPSTYFPPPYENNQSRRNLGGDYSLMTHKFNSNNMNK